MILWIDRTLALAIHERQMAEHGGGTGVRDEGLLEFALAKPQQLFAYGDPPPDLAGLAASLAFGLARNHPFVDGNKRTAAVACELFLMLNGATLDADNLSLYPMYLSLAEGSVTEAEFADWLRPRVRVQPKHKVNEGKARQRR
ncbi:MAG: type II toxin-antitoxin system death-on-curing family toxin [Thermomonas sp.]|nr:type II toxin-antitoxin system death-on-curing family toxin [Thermomonas sp.]